jgi:hypothetical protein
MPTGHLLPKPKPARKRRKVSPEERQRRSDWAKQNLRPVSRMRRDELLSYIDERMAELGYRLDNGDALADDQLQEMVRLLRDGLTPDQAADRLAQKPAEPAASGTAKQSAKQPLSADAQGSMVKPSPAAAKPSDPDREADTFDSDPALHSAYVQTARELRHEAPDEELQAARAFEARFGSTTPSYATPHETEKLLQAVRRAYRSG